MRAGSIPMGPGGPYRPLTDNRAFLLKYSRTLRLEW